MDLRNKSMYQALLEAKEDFPNGTAVYYQGKKISFRKLIKRIDDMADVLQNRLDIHQNDVILIAQPNIPEALVIFYAANKIGAICNMVHPFTPFNKVLSIMEKTHTKVAFLFEQRVAKEVESYREHADNIYVTRIEDSLPFFTKIVYHIMNRNVRNKLKRYTNKFPGFKYVYKLKPTGKPVYEPQNKWKDTSVLLHSGSTTGDPKTICLCDWNFNFISQKACEFLSCKPEDIRGKAMLSVLPSFHGFGLTMTMHAPMVNRFASALMPKFTAKGVVKVMKDVKLASICGVPTMYESLLKCEDFTSSKYIKNLYVCFCGGDSLSVSLKDRWDTMVKNAGGNSQLFEGYGLTEAVCVNAVNTYANNRPGSFGKAMSDATFRIVDENENEVPRGELGEITLKSDAVMNGYLNDEENTKQALRNGWLHTGDLGWMDEDGFIFFKQRMKRVIKVSGVGVFPTEVEKLVETIPGVDSVCAIRIPDDRLQSAIKLFVVADYFDETVMKKEIIDKCRQNLIRWSVPKEIEFRKELPLTQLGKIDFNKLQKEENAKRGITE